jgi:hypothetical protein
MERVRRRKDVVYRDDPEHVSVGIRHRQREPVVALKRFQHLFAIVRGVQRNHRRILDVENRRIRIGENERRQADVFDQLSASVDDVDDIDRLHSAPCLSDVLERFAGPHLRIDRDVLRRM